MSRTEPLLTAKLHRPRVTRDLVARPRLLTRLDAGLAGPLTVVVATAGFGKTTLVSSWVEELAMGWRPGLGVVPTAWLSLDEGDGNLLIFLRYFITALRGIFPNAAPQTWQLVFAHQNPPLDYLATVLSNEIESLPARFVIVLDDAHTLPNQAVYDLLNAWLQHWPHPMHMVLVSRRHPSLSLTNWRARGKVVELQSRDMRFTEAEAAEFLDKALGKNVDREKIAMLHGQMDGWITGLRLAALSMDPDDGLAQLPSQVLAGEVHINDYLIEEILLRQPSEIQQFLLTISVARQFCESLCVALLDDKDPTRAARQMLDYLEVHELFQVHLDDRGEWLRFHHLFRTLVMQRLREERGQGAVNDLHRAAALWYASHDLPDEALFHAGEAQDTALMTQILWQGLRDVLNREDRLQLEHWVAMLPQDASVQSPELQLIRAWNHGLRWELAECRSRARQAEALLETRAFSPAEQEKEQLIRAHLLIIAGQAAYDRNEPTIAATACREGHDLLPADWLYLRGVAATFAALGLQASGRAAEAEQFLTSSFGASENKISPYALRLLLGLALNSLQSGRLESAHQIAKVLLHQAELGQLNVMRGWGHYLIGYINYHFGELATAETHYQAAAAMRFTTQLLVARCASFGLVQVYAAQGKFPRAQAQIEDLIRLDLLLYGREDPSAVAARALLLVQQGDAGAAAEWISAVPPPLDERPLVPWSEHLLLARLATLIARNRANDVAIALHELDTIDDIATRTFNNRTPVALLALRAMALLAQGNVAMARESLIRSVELARRTGHRQLYVDLGEPMRRLLRQIAAEHTVSTTVADILAAFPSRDGTLKTVIPDDAPIGEHLTRRELEVLHLMAKSVSFAHIAGELNISTATVKRHTIRVYDKLGVHSRWEAVAKAVELGILRSS